jgi:hypothetical protein
MGPHQAREIIVLKQEILKGFELILHMKKNKKSFRKTDF